VATLYDKSVQHNFVTDELGRYVLHPVVLWTNASIAVGCSVQVHVPFQTSLQCRRCLIDVHFASLRGQYDVKHLACRIEGEKVSCQFGHPLDVLRNHIPQDAVQGEKLAGRALHLEGIAGNIPIRIEDAMQCITFGSRRGREHPAVIPQCTSHHSPGESMVLASLQQHLNLYRDRTILQSRVDPIPRHHAHRVNERPVLTRDGFEPTGFNFWRSPFKTTAAREARQPLDLMSGSLWIGS
jgi:hypothetical protein